MVFRRFLKPPPAQAHAVISSSQQQPIHRVDARYLSFSIDISVFAGGFWWEGSLGSKRGLGVLPVPALSLSRKRLNKLVAALAPAYLRIGGSEADKIHYFSAPAEERDALVLSKSQWDDLHAFLQRHNLKLIFTCKYGLFQRRIQGKWQADELDHLLRYSCENGYDIEVFELGNELNAYWAFHGLRSQPGPQNLAQDYDRFSQAVREYYPQALISGPGSAFWPRLGEAVPPFSNITPRFLASLKRPLDIVDWHFYPFQSERSPVRTRSATIGNMMNPKALDAYARYSRRLRRLRDKFQPQAQLWTGETGSAQCGGQPGLSDRWASCFWWADQLGAGAQNGQRVMVRQALIGGDYGLIDRLSLKPRPDYWLSWVWGQLMGAEVYAVNSSLKQLRVYLHGNAQGRGKTLLLINLSAEPVVVHADFGEVYARYCLTAKRLTSKRLCINGVKPKLRSGKVDLCDFPQLDHSDVVLGHSINFWCFSSDHGGASAQVDDALSS